MIDILILMPNYITGITYMYHMMISNNVWTNPWPGPWQWTADTTRPDNRSSLLDPAHTNYMKLKKMIEEAVRNLKIQSSLDDMTA